MNLPIANILDVLNQAVSEILEPPKGVELDGWTTFNKFTGGLRPYEFSIFCGPTGSGKTLWLSSLTAKLIEQNQKVFVAPVEIGEVAFTKMVLSAFAKKDFVSGDVPTSEDKDSLMFALKKFQNKIEENLVVTTYDGRVDIDEMIDILGYVNTAYSANVAILDNLNFFLKPSKSSESILEMDESVHKFVQFSKKNPMHTILVMHPKKTIDGKIISEFDIKGSSTSVQEATNVLLMNRLTEDEIETYGLTEFDREFVFKKIRKRGKYVNKRFFMCNTGGLGNYQESTQTLKSSVSRNSQSFTAKWGRSTKSKKQPIGQGD